MFSRRQQQGWRFVLVVPLVMKAHQCVPVDTHSTSVPVATERLRVAQQLHSITVPSDATNANTSFLTLLFFPLYFSKTFSCFSSIYKSSAFVCACAGVFLFVACSHFSHVLPLFSTCEHCTFFLCGFALETSGPFIQSFLFLLLTSREVQTGRFSTLFWGETVFPSCSRIEPIMQL